MEDQEVQILEQIGKMFGRFQVVLEKDPCWTVVFVIFVCSWFNKIKKEKGVTKSIEYGHMCLRLFI